MQGLSKLKVGPATADAARKIKKEMVAFILLNRWKKNQVRRLDLLESNFPSGHGGQPSTFYSSKVKYTDTAQTTQRDTERHGTGKRVTESHSTERHDTGRHGTERNGLVL